MISADFAPNEAWDDAWISIKLLFQPWEWKVGTYTTLIKRKLKKIFPKSEFFFFLTGRSALYNLLKALKLPQDSQVLVQAFTCEAVILPILANNLRPIYIDIEDKTYSMDSKDLENKITNNAKVLILQHTFGMTPINRDLILNLVKKYNLFVIEDFAHGFSPSNQYPITNNSCYLLSFGRSKALSSVHGGAAVIKNKRIAERIRSNERTLKNPEYLFIAECLLYKPLAMFIKSTYSIYLGKIFHQLIKIVNLIPVEISVKEKTGQFDIIFNKAYPNALANLLYHQLKKYDQMQKQRIKISDLYYRYYHISPVFRQPLLRFPLQTNKRDAILEKASQQNIFLGNWYEQAVAPKELDLNRVEYPIGSCPTAEKIAQKIINLPTYIFKSQANRIINILNDV